MAQELSVSPSDTRGAASSQSINTQPGLLDPVKKNLFFKWNKLACFPRGTDPERGICWVVLGRTKVQQGPTSFCPHVLGLQGCWLLRCSSGPWWGEGGPIRRVWAWEGVDRGGPEGLSRALPTSGWGGSGEALEEWPGGFCWHPCAGRDCWGVGSSTQTMSRPCSSPKRDVWVAGMWLWWSY